jgi:7-cyano-7-deazaguanine synthase
MANVGTKAGLSGRGLVIETPLINMAKAEIIAKGTGLGVDYSLTHSCYDPDQEGRACGACDSCLIRKKGFLDAGVPDPTRYRF